MIQGPGPGPGPSSQNPKSPRTTAWHPASACQIAGVSPAQDFVRQPEIYGWLTVVAGTGEGGRRHEDRPITACRPAVRDAPVIGRHGRHGAPERTFCRAVEVRVRRILSRSCVVRGAGHLQPDGVRVSPHGDGRARHRVNQHQTCPPQARKPLKADGRTMPPGARNLVPGRHKSGSVIGLSPQAASAPAA